VWGTPTLVADCVQTSEGAGSGLADADAGRADAGRPMSARYASECADADAGRPLARLLPGGGTDLSIRSRIQLLIQLSI
jgi:hypothetical protein